MPWHDFADLERSFSRVPPLHEMAFAFAGGEVEEDEPGSIEDLVGLMGGR